MKKVIIATAFVFAFAINAQAQQKLTVKSKSEKSASTVTFTDNATTHKKLMARGNALMKNGNYSKAAAVFTDALALNTDTVNTLEHRAMALNLDKQYKSALEDLNKLIEMGEGNIAQDYFLRATAKLGLKDSEGACEDLKKAKELGHDVRWEGYVEVCGK